MFKMELSPKKKSLKSLEGKKSPKVKFDENIKYVPIPPRVKLTTTKKSSELPETILQPKRKFGTLILDPQEMEKFEMKAPSLIKTPSNILDLSLEGEEILTTLSIGDVIKLPKNQLRNPIYVEILKKLGSGAYGEVYEVKIDPRTQVNIPEYFPNQETYALKIMKDTNYSRAFEYEQRIMNIISYAYPDYIPRCAPHVACYFDISKDGQGRYYFLAEKMDGDVSDYIRQFLYKDTKNMFDNKMKFALNLFRQVMCGLEELRNVGIVHRDLKAANILYRIPSKIYTQTTKKGKSRKVEKKLMGQIQFKIGDFGLSCSLTDKNLECGKYVTGTPKYIDPKLYDDVISGKAVNMDTIWDETNDVYSLAVILFEIIFEEDYLTLEVHKKTKIPVASGPREREKKLKEMKEAFDKLYEGVSSLQKDGYIDNILTIYKNKPKYRQMLEFIMKNMQPFEKKQTIDQVKKQYKIIFKDQDEYCKGE